MKIYIQRYIELHWKDQKSQGMISVLELQYKTK